MLQEDAVMVGDRSDNDIAPARRLGMQTIRILRGPSAFSEPPSAEDRPEFTIRTLAELIPLMPASRSRIL